MKTLPCPRLLFRCALLVAGLLAATSLRAVDVSGTYEAVGADVPAAGAPRTTVSLAALICLQLNHAAGLKEQADIATVRLEQTDASLSVRTADARGEARWGGRWERQRGFNITEDYLPRLAFRAPHLGDDFYALTFRLEANGAVLVVDLDKFGPKLSGQKPEKLGTFLFTRAEKR